MIAAILLAAGESKRMGAPKALLEWGGGKLIEYQIAELKAAGVDDVVVVIGHCAHEVMMYVEKSGARSVFNERYAEGRASSLRVGAAAVDDSAETIVVLGVDQPRPRELTARLLREHAEHGATITVPTFEGHRGHPPVLSGSLLPELREVREESLGIRAVLERHTSDVWEVPFDSDAVLLDVNDPQAYERARTKFSQETAP